MGRSMRKNEDRKVAEQLFLEEKGRITNKEVARNLSVHPATIARWRKLDEWDMKLVQEVTSPYSSPEEEDFYAVDLRHIKSLNERIEIYLQKKELLPSEILELAQSKYHLMSCMEIINDTMRFPLLDEYVQDDDSIE